MMMAIFKSDRRGFLRLVGLGGAVFASGLPGVRAFAGGKGTGRKGSAAEDFFFVQLSDTHWGFSGPPNPEAANTLKEAVSRVNALPRTPDFVVFTGDLTHTTDDATVRRRRMAEFKEIVAGLDVKTQYYMPGEHDASLDAGKAFQESFGHTHYSFDHKGIHFAVLDNVSDPEAKLGDAQLDWLRRDLKRLAPDAPIVIFTHRPLFDLAPQWDWATKDGAKAIDLLGHFKHVTVFYGHIHQEHHH
jgi:3',5'-cyclic AMP phosphodiesterase CpdA